MKKILRAICFTLVVFYSFINNAVASDVVISGSTQFDCSLSSKFMEKHGYVFIEESYYESYLTTNMYAARDAEVIVENEHGAVLGTGIADKKGKFSITVPKGDLYNVIARFHGNEIIKQVQFPKLENVIVYIGYFKSDVVDNWLRTAGLNDCDNC